MKSTRNEINFVTKSKIYHICCQPIIKCGKRVFLYLFTIRVPSTIAMSYKCMICLFLHKIGVRRL